MSIVRTGPFAGMLYGHTAHGSQLLPKVVGSYEAEIAAIVRRATLCRYRLVLDIGAAEGYYAVGFARALPDACIKAYEIDRAAREDCRRLALLNGVADRVELNSGCSAETLASLDVSLWGALIICDAEGAEAEILQPQMVGDLSGADILVETHDFLVPGVTDTLIERFTLSHDITRVVSVPRSPDPYRHLDGLIKADAVFAVNEFRPPQAWLHLAARAPASALPGASRAIGASSLQNLG